MQAYSDPKRANDPHALPDVEVFHINAHEAERNREEANQEGTAGESGLMLEAGWYWWPCFPGCLPDGDPSGPFATEAEALADAQSGSDDD